MDQEKMAEVPILKVEGLKKYYPVKGGVITHKIGDLKAVNGVSFSMREGETLGLVGESGCGKSTLGRQIVGLERPTEGKVFYKGRDLGAMKPKDLKPVRTQLQMVFQDSFSSLNPRKHVYEILSEPMLYHKIVSKGELEGELKRLLDMVGLPMNALGRYPHEFSGGQRQRICIARALSLNPRFLVCDEPVSALDVSIQAQILNLLRQLQNDLGLTCIFIGHGLGAVNYVSDRIAVMYLGKIVELAPARQLFEHPVHPYSRALFQAAPSPDPRDRREGGLLEGEIASNVNLPEGCPFHPRCPYRKEECLRNVPQLLPVGADGEHLAACPVMGAEADGAASPVRTAAETGGAAAPMVVAAADGKESE